MIDLNSDNIKLYAIQAYDNPHCLNVREFNLDFNKFVVFKRLLTRLNNGENMEVRSLVNILICLFNVFKREHCLNMLKYFVFKDQYPQLKAFLKFIHLDNGLLDQYEYDHKLYNTLNNLYS